MVPPSFRMFPVMVDSNKLMVSLVQDGDSGARKRHDLVAHQVDVHALDAVRQHVLEGEARQGRPTRVLIPLSGCLGARSVGKAAMNSVLG